MQQTDFTFPFPPLQVRAGVLVVDGYGIALRVLYGKLRVEDGIADRRPAPLPCLSTRHLPKGKRR
jgi:hypothetical protein